MPHNLSFSGTAENISTLRNRRRSTARESTFRLKDVVNGAFFARPSQRSDNRPHQRKTICTCRAEARKVHKRRFAITYQARGTRVRLEQNRLARSDGYWMRVTSITSASPITTYAGIMKRYSN